MRRLIAWLCMAGLLIAGALAIFLVEIIMREDTERRIALEHERATLQRDLAERQALLDRETALISLAAASLQRFASEFRGSDLQTRLDAAAYYAELAPDEATAARWKDVMSYIESLIAARTEEYRKLQAAISANRQRYIAATNEIVASGAASLAKNERLSTLDGEAAALSARAARIALELGQPAQAGAESEAGLASNSEQTSAAIMDPGPPAPTPLAPRDGTVFTTNGRQTLVAWTPIPGAQSYSLEIDCFACCEPGQWCSDVGREYLTVRDLDMTRFAFEFAGKTQGRWRVWSVSSGGESGPKSDWSQFSFAK